MPGSKYTVEINLAGNLRSGLKDVEKGLGKVQKQLSDFQGVHKESQKVDEKNSILGKIGGHLKGDAIKEFGEKLGEYSARFKNFARGVMQSGEGLFKEIIGDAALFEDTASSMRFAFGSEWESVMDKVKRESAKLTFTFQEVSELAASMGRMDINPFGTSAEKLDIFKSKTGEMVSALEVLQDTADAVGKSTGDLTASIRNAMAGDWVSLQDRFDIPRESIKEWRKEIDKTTDKQEKYNILVAKLAEMFGGAGKEKAMNWNKAIAQVPDLLQQLRAGVGEAGLKVLTKEVFGFVDALKELVTDKEAVKALSDAFLMVAEAVGFVIRLGAKVVIWIKDILKAAPWLPKLAIGFTLIAVAASALLGVLLGIVSTLLVAAGTIAMVGAKAMLVAAGISIALLPVLLAVAAGAALIGLLFYAIGQNIQKGMGGTSLTLLEKVKLVLEGIGELLGSYDGKTGKLSEGMAEKLRKAGLLEFVTDLFKIYHRVRTFFSSFIDTLSMIGDLLAPVILPMLEELKLAFFEFTDALGITNTKTKAAGSDTKSWAEAGKALALVIVAIVGELARMITIGARIARLAMEFKIIQIVLGLIAVNAAAWAVAMVPIVLLTAAIATPFIMISALLGTIINKMVMFAKLIKEVVTGSKSFGDAMSEFGASFVKDQGESWAKYGLRQVFGLEDTETVSKGPGGVPVASDTPAITSVPSGVTTTPGVLGGASSAVSEALYAGAGTQPAVPVAGEDPAAAAIEKSNGILAQIKDALGNAQTIVQIDSEDVAARIQRNGRLVNGAD